MVISRRSSVLFAAVVLLSGCAALPQTGYNKEANNAIKTVAVPQIAIPEKADVRIIAPVGANFGLIGAIVEESRFAAARTRLQNSLASVNFDFKSLINSELQRSLTEAGFAPSFLAADPAKKTPTGSARKEWAKKLGQQAGSDAYLDVTISGFGYFAAGATTDFKPGLGLWARLIETKSGKTLFEDQIVYNPAYAATKAITIEPDSQYSFNNQDALNSDPGKAAAGLSGAITAVTNELSKQFR